MRSVPTSNRETIPAQGNHRTQMMADRVARRVGSINTCSCIAALGLVGLGAVLASHELAEIVVVVHGLRARRMAPDSSSFYSRTNNATTLEVVHA